MVAEGPGDFPHCPVFLRFWRWEVKFLWNRLVQRTPQRPLSLSFPDQSGAVECRRMSCPPLNCSPDSLPVHIPGQCCKVCRRKYSPRVSVVLCALRVMHFPLFLEPSQHLWIGTLAGNMILVRNTLHCNSFRCNRLCNRFPLYRSTIPSTLITVCHWLLFTLWFFSSLLFGVGGLALSYQINTHMGFFLTYKCLSLAYF